MTDNETILEKILKFQADIIIKVTNIESDMRSQLALMNQRNQHVEDIIDKKLDAIIMKQDVSIRDFEESKKGIGNDIERLRGDIKDLYDLDRKRMDKMDASEKALKDQMAVLQGQAGTAALRAWLFVAVAVGGAALTGIIGLVAGWAGK